jgi:hypothetical protein
MSKRINEALIFATETGNTHEGRAETLRIGLS